jgi:DNA-binding beta-propeller fold protein YncE
MGILSWPDISSASIIASYTIPSGTFYNDICFNSDGTKAYLSEAASRSIKQFSLATAYDISTLSDDSVSVAIDGNTIPAGLFFKPDGTKFFVIANYLMYTKKIQQYSLSTPWDLSTATYDSYKNTINNYPFGLYVKPDGLGLYVANDMTNKIHQYTLSTAWDLSSLSYTTIPEFSTTSQEPDPRGVFFKDDGTKMYVSGSSSGDLHQYTLSTRMDIWLFGKVNDSTLMTSEINFNTGV